MKNRLVSSGVALIVLACAVCTGVAQQPQERVIRRLPVEENEPIAITDIKVDGRSVSLDKKFTADDEWLRSLVFSVKNKSHKLILFASILLQFPRSEGSQDRVSIFQMFDGNWALQVRQPTSAERLVGIAPGETVEIGLSAQRFVGLREFLTGTKYPASIEKVDVSIDHIIFEDDTMWSGEEFRRDSNDPTTWIPSRPPDSKPR